LLLRTPEMVRAFSPDGVTALHLACFYGQEEAVERLLQAGADPSAQARNATGLTPVDEAASTGQWKIVDLLQAACCPSLRASCQDWTDLRLAAGRAR